LTVRTEVIQGLRSDTVSNAVKTDGIACGDIRLGETSIRCSHCEVHQKGDDIGRPATLRFHSHSIINNSRKSAWLKGFALIDIGRYRRFYRQKNRSFAGAGLRGIGSSSIST
jgi:hypothetical protein